MTPILRQSRRASRRPACLRWRSRAAPARAASDAEVAAELMQPGPLPDIVEGAAAAPSTIIEYASMTCSHCAAFHAAGLADAQGQICRHRQGAVHPARISARSARRRRLHGRALPRPRQARRPDRQIIRDPDTNGPSATSRSSGCARRPDCRRAIFSPASKTRRCSTASPPSTIPPPSDSASIRRRPSSSTATIERRPGARRNSTKSLSRRRNRAVSHRFLRGGT